jgi:diguanylate cyclase
MGAARVRSAHNKKRKMPQAMNAQSNPTDIARETLKQLAVRRIAPTPDNYRELYHKISGESEADLRQPQDQKLAALAAALPESQAKRREAVERALAHRDWTHARGALLALVESAQAREPGGGDEDWPHTTRDLIKALDARHAGWTRARKHEAVERMLSLPAREGNSHVHRLRSLMHTWNESPPADVPEVAAAANEAQTDLTQSLRECLTIALDVVLPGVLRGAPDLAWEARMLSTRARQAADTESLVQIGNDLRQFTRRVEFHAGGDAEVREGLLRILRALIDNIQDLVDNDHWIQGQIAIVRNALDRPLTPESIEQAEQAIRDLALKQGALKRSLDEAKESLKALLQDFIVRLGDLSGDTDDYHTKLQTHSENLQKSTDITVLTEVVRELMKDTRAMQTSANQARVALAEARDHVQAAELRIREMESELEQLSERVREDQLTGTLNRRGLDDAFKREAGRADRQSSSMCVALLDVDNFKNLNDTLGHQAGDEALLHLVKVIRSQLRPADALARYGGEEFAILLPDSNLEEAVDVMTRLQRELTKQFFLHKNDRLLITFSCGVALRLANEDMEPAMGRADKALYAAKRAGKNRVVAADDLPLAANGAR